MRRDTGQNSLRHYNAVRGQNIQTANDPHTPAGREIVKAKPIFIVGLKVLILTLVLVICFIVASVVSGIATTQPSGLPTSPGVTESQQSEGMDALVFTSFLITVVFTYLILRSRWSGRKLVGALVVAFYGLMTVISQIESVVYLQHRLPAEMIPKLFIMGAVVAVLFCPLAVLILGKRKEEMTASLANVRLVMPPGEWVWKLAMIAVAYLILYFTFGYYVAWKSPEVQAYYGGTDPGTFFAQIGYIWHTTPWMFPFQAFRGILWLVFVLPVVRMLKGRSWETALAIAILFSVWSAQLILPNPFMPRGVAMAHLLETVSSNLIFGWIVGWLFSRHHPSVSDVFQRSK